MSNRTDTVILRHCAVAKTPIEGDMTKADATALGLLIGRLETIGEAKATSARVQQHSLIGEAVRIRFKRNVKLHGGQFLQGAVQDDAIRSFVRRLDPERFSKQHGKKIPSFLYFSMSSQFVFEVIVKVRKMKRLMSVLAAELTPGPADWRPEETIPEDFYSL